jgi:hypothetical protein
VIKWRGKGKGRELIGLGLEEKNLERLRAGDPIHIFGGQMGLPFDILIYYGKDMAALLAMSKGAVGPDTVIRDERARRKS